LGYPILGPVGLPAAILVKRPRPSSGETFRAQIGGPTISVSQYFGPKPSNVKTFILFIRCKRCVEIEVGFFVGLCQSFANLGQEQNEVEVGLLDWGILGCGPLSGAMQGRDWRTPQV